METPANEGGIGGPFRRRPFRRGASTPYDRPPTALRGVREGGWISKLVDPASRLIASGASKLFSSMFRKRLTAPPSTPEEGRQSREDASQVACFIPSPEIQNGDRDGDNETNRSDSGGIAELEQLLKQKTFTRIEFDHLAELLRSRTVETLKPEHGNNNEKMEKASVSAQEGGIGSSKVHESLKVPAGDLTMLKQIPKDEAASPAELAKVYMGSRPSKVSPSVESFRNQVFQEDANLLSIPSTSKRLDLSVAPRSAMRFSGIPEHPEHSYQTARPPGRSAIYRMSRSPYFKVNPKIAIQVGELSRDDYSCQSSQWTPSAMKSGGKKVLKRGSSTLDGDVESFGPIRRIRQKSNLISPSKEVRSLLSGSSLSSPSTPLFKDFSKGSMSVQKPLMLGERKHDSTSWHAVENGLSTGTILPSQSSETAQKLFQQLDKLLPSPQEKSSELKSIARDESPSKLTLDMLHGSALRSMEDINSSKFLSMQGSGKLDTASASHPPNITNTHSQKLDVVEENGPLKSVGSGVKLAFGANGVSNASIASKDAKPGVRSENMPVANSVPPPVLKRPAFQMSAPEDLLELDDDDDDDERDLSSPLTTAKDDADSTISKHNNVISEAAISENVPTTPQNLPVSSSISFRKADKKTPVQPVITEKANGFAFPVASDPCTQSQPPPTPTMPSPLLDRADSQKEQTTSPIFSFGSKDTKSPTFSSATISVNNAAGVECSNGPRSESTLTTSANTMLAEGAIIDKSKPQKAGDIFRSSENTVSSGTSTSSTPAAVFAFGASPPPSLTNGLLDSSSPTFSAPHSATGTLSEGPVSSIFTNGIATTSCSSSLFVSSAAATFSTVPSFQFGSGISTTTPVSVSQPLEKSNSVILEANSVKASQFSISSSTSQAAASLFPSIESSSSTDVAKLVTIFSSGSSFPALSTPLVSSGISSSSAPSSSFPSTVGSSSCVAPSSAFLSAGSSAFGFTASTQSTGSSPSFANNSSQNSTVTTFGATGGSTMSSPLFASSSANNSTASTFGATGGLVFGSQSAQSGTAASQISQSLTSQFNSFSSFPSFGFGNSSSGGFGNSSSGGFGTSPFGSVTSGAKPFPSSPAFSFSAGAGSSSANSSSSFTPAAIAGPFGSSSQESTSSIFASTSSSNTSPSTGFTFGLSASVSNNSPFTFGSSSLSVFPFTSSGTTASSTSSFPAPVFGMPNPAVGFGSSSPGNDQMNDDSMADDTNQAATALVPAFGQPASLSQPANLSPAPSFMFGSPAVQPGGPVFQFGVPQNPSPFPPAGNVEFTAGGSFSLGSGGGDKSSRKFVKVKRDKPRKK